MSLITFENFSFKYENLKLPTLKNINLNIEAGEKVLIAGPSGSGKSTLAHCINGLIPFNYKGEIAGTLKINGIEPYKKSIHEISNYVGTILQDQDGQFVGLTVGEDVAFTYENDNVPVDEMHKGVTDALKAVDMLSFINETPHNLSGGQKQKVSIAGILATNASILLFDEPLANLDPASGKKAMETINNLHEISNKTIIIVEHRIEDVLEHNFDRIIIVSEGKIAADGNPDDILASNILNKYGLREPLYVEALKNVNIKIKPEDKISKLENAMIYKDIVLNNYRQNKFEKQPDASNPVLTLEGISYKYYKSDPHILKNISFNINKGEMLAILGNNGAGKSTLLKVISGIAKPQKGSIKYKGQSIDKWSVKKRSSVIGYVMQNPNHMLTKDMIFDEVAFGLRNSGYKETDIQSIVQNTLTICGLQQYRKWPVSALSFGQKKRVTIASILSMKPEIVILDEPTAGQDYRNYKEFMHFLEQIKSTGISIVLITHDMHLALEYADRAVVISSGEIIAEDNIYTILSNEKILEKANLMETSISKLAHLYQIENPNDFLRYFTKMLKDGESNE